MIENEPTTGKKSGLSPIVIGIAVLLCCICVLVGGMAWIIARAIRRQSALTVRRASTADGAAHGA